MGIKPLNNRLLRRIIRDYKYRGVSAQETIRRWPSVRSGENKWIVESALLAVCLVEIVLLLQVTSDSLALMVVVSAIIIVTGIVLIAGIIETLLGLLVSTPKHIT